MKLPHFIRPDGRGYWHVYTNQTSQGEYVGFIIRYTTKSLEDAQQKAKELDNHDY